MNGDEALDAWDAHPGRPEPGRRADPQGAPLLVAEDISREAMAAIETGARPPGRKIVSRARGATTRMAALAAHVLGYMNEISADELRAKKDEGYRAGDLIGRTGIERQWERLPARPRRASRRSSSIGAASPQDRHPRHRRGPEPSSRPSPATTSC